MSLKRCLPDLVKKGEIDPARAKRMEDLFDELEAFYRRSMGPDAAAAEASEATLRHLRAEARLKKRQTLLQVNRQREALKELERFKGGTVYKAIAALIDDDDRAAYRGGNVVTAAKRIEYQAHAQIGEFIERHRRDLLGRPRDQQTLENVGRELYGESTGDAAARRMAEAIDGSRDTLRQRFNAAGGAIGKLKRYGLPQRSDPLRVRSVSREEWIADARELTERAEWIDDRTGQPMNDERLDEVLGGIYENIRTNGLTGEASSAYRGAGKLANRRSDHRVLHFRDFDAWQRYMAKYGDNTDVFSAVVDHVSGLSKDVAIMERLGPNPDATMRYLLDHADRSRAQSGDVNVAAVQGTSGGRKATEDLWRYVKGETSVPVVPETQKGQMTVAGVHGLRNINVASKLGSALIASLTDVQQGKLARSFYGLPEAKAISYYVRAFTPRSAEDRALAQRLGAGMEDAARTMRSTVRLYGEARGPGWSQTMADSVLRMSGLNMWTRKQQEMFVKEFLGHLGDNRGRTWEQLPERMREAFEKNGIDAWDWNGIRRSEPIMSGGGAYIDPQAIRDPATGDRLMNMVLRGRAGAVIEASPSSQVAVNLGTQGGTLGGEILRNSFQFKSFAVAAGMKNFRMAATLTPSKRGLFAAEYVIGMTLFGAMVINLREIAKGNDPKPMDTEDFWIAALLQGGGIGIAGDLLEAYASDDRMGGIGQFLGGPVASQVANVFKAGKKALPGTTEAGNHREGRPGAALVEFARKETPGSNLFYARLAFERLLWDRLDAYANENVYLDRERRARPLRQRGQGQWWEPGKDAPERAPDLTTALGKSR